MQQYWDICSSPGYHTYWFPEHQTHPDSLPLWSPRIPWQTLLLDSCEDQAHVWGKYEQEWHAGHLHSVQSPSLQLQNCVLTRLDCCCSIFHNFAPILVTLYSPDYPVISVIPYTVYFLTTQAERNAVLTLTYSYACAVVSIVTPYLILDTTSIAIARGKAVMLCSRAQCAVSSDK